jgi:hypothetical protein
VATRLRGRAHWVRPKPRVAFMCVLRSRYVSRRCAERPLTTCERAELQARGCVSSAATLAVALGASSEPRQSANGLNEVALVQRAHGAARSGRPYGLRSVGRPPSDRSFPGRDPHRAALLPATPRVWSSFSDRPAQRGAIATTAGGQGPSHDEEGVPFGHSLRRHGFERSGADGSAPLVSFRAQVLAVERAGVGGFPQDCTCVRSAGGVSRPLIAQLVRDSAPCSVERLDVISLIGQHEAEGLAQPGLNLRQGRAYPAARPKGPCQLRGSPFQPRHDALVEGHRVTFRASRSPRLPRVTGRPLRGTRRGRDDRGRPSVSCGGRWRACCRPCGGSWAFGHDRGPLCPGVQKRRRDRTQGAIEDRSWCGPSLQDVTNHTRA